MDQADASKATVLVLAVVLAVMGGWVVSEARQYHQRHQRSLTIGGCMLLVIALSLVNRGRHPTMFAEEDWVTISLRGVAIACGIAALVCCAITCGGKRGE